MPSRLQLLASALLVTVAVALATTVEGQSSWLSRCSKEFGSQKRYLYVSTLDGILTALDDSGVKQWSYQLPQPLYSSTLSYSKPTSDVPNLIPGLDRHLYHWNGTHLVRLAFTADDLVHGGAYSSPGVVRSGAKAKDDMALNIVSGKPLYHCNQLKCEKYDNQSLIGHADTLLVSIHRTTVREAVRKTGDEIWNFTVSEVHLSLIEGSEGEDFSCQVNEWLLSRWIVNVDTSSSKIRVSDSDSHTSWEYKFLSPVSSVWIKLGGKLVQVPLSPLTNELQQQPALLLAMWNNQYYIQPTIGHLKYDHELTTDILNPNCIAPPTSEYLPSYPASYLSTLTSWLDMAKDDNNALTLYHDDDQWLRDLYTDGPNGLALYFHPKVQASSLEGTCSGEENTSENNIPPASSNLPVMGRAGYLRKAYDIGSSLLKYTIFAMCVLGVNKFRRYHKEIRNNFTLLNQDEDEVFENGYLAVTPTNDYIGRRNSSTSTIKASGTYPLLPIVEEDDDGDSHRVARIDSVESVGSTSATSRYESEYNYVGCLGRGGFGVVLHVKNRVDGNEYALKRIKLPTKKAAKEKVMREVHALAKLDHSGIVRYFNSWVEKAPNGWDQREEWVSLSQTNSLMQSEDPALNRPSSELGCGRPSPHSPSSISTTSSESTSVPLPLSALPSLNDELSLLNNDSRNSSFTIEFRDDSSSCIRPSSASSDLVHHGSMQQVSSSDADRTSEEEPSANNKTSHNSSTNDSRHSVCPLLEPPTFLFIQMQLCQKETLKDWLRTNITNRQRREVLEMFEQILGAVVYVHNKGLMHRDLKPSNIFFAPDGTVKVGDFGLVTGNISPDTHQNSYIGLKFLADEVTNANHSHTGNVGTHFYVSPEQMKGLKYDQKVDIFSLGVIYFELNFPFSTEMERSKVLEDLRKGRFPKEFKQTLIRETDFVEWLMSAVVYRPSAEEVYQSASLKELKTAIESSDLTLIPKF